MEADEGCLCFIGVVCVAPAVGCLYGAAYGWITLGAGFIAIAVISTLCALAKKFVERRRE